MAVITAPPAPSHPFYLAKGLYFFGDNFTLMIFGQALPNYLHLVPPQHPGPLSVVDATTLFDVTGIGGLSDGTTPAHYGIDNEVVVNSG